MAVLWVCIFIAVLILERAPKGLAESNFSNTQISEEEVLGLAIESFRFWQFEGLIFITNRLE